MLANWQNEREEWTVSDYKKTDKNRDNYVRCKQCGDLWHQEQCILDNIAGYQCPKGCVESYQQPSYESPLNE